MTSWPRPQDYYNDNEGSFAFFPLPTIPARPVLSRVVKTRIIRSDRIGSSDRIIGSDRRIGSSNRIIGSDHRIGSSNRIVGLDHSDWIIESDHRIGSSNRIVGLNHRIGSSDRTRSSDWIIGLDYIIKQKVYNIIKILKKNKNKLKTKPKMMQK